MAEMKPERRRQLRTFIAKTAGHLDTPDGYSLLDLASNDTLGISKRPEIIAAAIASIKKNGVGASASRLVSGSRPEHKELEQSLANWLGKDRVLLYPSGFQANIAAVAALADRHSLVIADRLIHNSLLVGIRASGAKLQRFAHNNLDQLEEKLITARNREPERQLLVISESLFSMEGSSPAVESMAKICQAHNAQLLLDEAHALGVLGSEGRGLGYGVEGVSLISGTFGKAFGSGGAFLASAEPLGERILQTSGAFRYSTALAPSLAAAALASLELIKGDYGKKARAKLANEGKRWRDQLAYAGWERPPGVGPIIALKIGSDKKAIEIQAALEKKGLLAIAIRPPTVPEGETLLRISLKPWIDSDCLQIFISIINEIEGKHEK
jgi:8-amino-7-oxononanoate synthase